MIESPDNQPWLRRQAVLIAASLAAFCVSTLISVLGLNESSVLNAESAVMVSAPLLAMALLVRHRVIGIIGLTFGTVVASVFGYGLLESEGSTAGIGLLFVVPAVLGVVLLTAAVDRALNNYRQRRTSLNETSTVSSRVVAFVIDIAVVAVVTIAVTTVFFDGVYSTPSAIVAGCFLFFHSLVGNLTRSATLGQQALRLTLIDIRSRRRPKPLTQVGRTLVIIAEIGVTLMFPFVIVIDFIVLATSGRSLADNVFHTSVIFRDTDLSNVGPVSSNGIFASSIADA